MRAIAAALFFGFAVASVLCSDIFIRAKGLDGKFGLDAFSYDLVGTIVSGIAVVAFLIEMRRGGAESQPRKPRPKPEPWLPANTRDLLEKGQKLHE